MMIDPLWTSRPYRLIVRQPRNQTGLAQIERPISGAEQLAGMPGQMETFVFPRLSRPSLGPWKWIVPMGLVAAAALAMLFALTGGISSEDKPLQAASSPTAGVSVPTPAAPTAVPKPSPTVQLPNGDARWSILLPGRKLAVPLDTDSEGKLDGVAVLVVGGTMHVDLHSSGGELLWSMLVDVGAGQRLSPRHLAPVDYDGDGLFDELLLEISGSAFRPATFPFGIASEAKLKTFAILDGEGEVLWFHQCGQITNGSSRTPFNSPYCDSGQAEAIYREKLEKHGYHHEGQLVAENFLRVDVDGEGSFGGAIELTVDGVQVR